MQLIGILTLARNDDTQAFQRFRKGLRKHYNEGIDISLHFRFANDETELTPLASQLLRIPVDVMVTGGMKALSAVTTQSDDIKIVHIGDHFPATLVNKPVTGHFLEGSKICRGQLDKLVSATTPQATVTVLAVDPLGAGNPLNNALYVDLKTYQTQTYPQVVLNPLAVTTRDQLHALTSAQVRQTFMLIPNGRLYDEKDAIARLVVGAAPGTKAIFPEREYKKAMGANPPPHMWVRGHDIPSTFEKAADHVRNFLDALTMVPPSPASEDIDPDAHTSLESAKARRSGH
jgi:hypothetical protein